MLVLAFTAAVSMLTGMLSGVLPALRASRVQPETVLRAEDGRGGSGRGALRAALVAVQIACALALGVCGTLMLRTLANRDRVALGFDPRGAVRADVSLAGDRYRDAAAVRTGVERILGEVRLEPDIVAAGAATWALPTAPGGQRAFTLPDGQLTALGGSIEAVTSSYLEALGAPLRAGRLFTEADRDGSAPVAIVNEELARRLWPNRNPLGERLRLGTAGRRGAGCHRRRSRRHDPAERDARHPGRARLPAVCATPERHGIDRRSRPWRSRLVGPSAAARGRASRLDAPGGGAPSGWRRMSRSSWPRYG